MDKLTPLTSERIADTPDRVIGKLVAKRGGDYDFDGEIRAVIVKRSGAVRYAVEDDRGLLLTMNASQCGLAEGAMDPDRVAQSVAWLRARDPEARHFVFPDIQANKWADAIEAGEPFKDRP